MSAENCVDDCMRWCVAMVVATAAGCDNSSAWSCSSAAAARCRPRHCVWLWVRWLAVALSNSQWQWCMPLSFATLLATADSQYNELQWTLAEQYWSSKLWRYTMTTVEWLQTKSNKKCYWLWRQFDGQRNYACSIACNFSHDSVDVSVVLCFLLL